MTRFPIRAVSTIHSALTLLACVGVQAGLATNRACAQDSVGIVPGGNDSVAAFDAAAQRLRYVVDLSPITSSWNSSLLIAPIVKASRDVDPMFRTQILGSIAVSPAQAATQSFAPRPFAVWSTPGAGVSPTQNSAPGLVNVSSFANQFGVSLSEFSLNPTSVVGAIVGRDGSNFARLYVERVVVATSRTSSNSPDTATLSIGGVDELGNVAVRADAFNTLATTTTRVLGDNIARVSSAARNASVVNALRSASGTNTSDDAAATNYIISNEIVPTNTPTLLNQPGVGPFAIAYDFSSRLRTGSTTLNLTTGSAHLPSGTAGHRGNPAYSPTSAAGGSGGTVASIALPFGAGARPNQLMAFGLSLGSAGAAPSVAGGTARAFALPLPISVPGFSANIAGTASFRQYLSQTPFRGGNGQVGVGRNALGQLVLAATATDPTSGNFIAALNVSVGGPATWTVAAFPGMIVRSSLNGPSIGTLSTPSTSFSSPGVDTLGNIYFVATWKPSLTAQEVGVFKAVASPAGYQLELLLRQGQTIAGLNSARSYTITSLALSDSDSVASGSMFSQSIIQQQSLGATTTDPTSIRAFGGLVVSSVITYDNAGSPESYDAVLYVGPTGSSCRPDFNNDSIVSVQDIFDFLAAWFAGQPSADFNNAGGVTVQDIFDFLSAWFAGC